MGNEGVHELTVVKQQCLGAAVAVLFALCMVVVMLLTACLRDVMILAFSSSSNMYSRVFRSYIHQVYVIGCTVLGRVPFGYRTGTPVGYFPDVPSVADCVMRTIILEWLLERCSESSNDIIR